MKKAKKVYKRRFDLLSLKKKVKAVFATRLSLSLTLRPCPEAGLRGAYGGSRRKP